MLILNPDLVMLDEIDSGLDVDAIQLVSKIISEEQNNGKGFLIVSHYARLYDLIKVDRTIVLIDGKIALDGDRELIKKIDKSGYDWLKKELNIVDEVKVSIGTCSVKDSLKGKK